MVIMEDNNPNKTFRTTHKVARYINSTQRSMIKGQALMLEVPHSVLITAVLGRNLMMATLTYEQAETVIEYGDNHIELKLRQGG